MHSSNKYPTTPLSLRTTKDHLDATNMFTRRWKTTIPWRIVSSRQKGIVSNLQVTLKRRDHHPLVPDRVSPELCSAIQGMIGAQTMEREEKVWSQTLIDITVQGQSKDLDRISWVRKGKPICIFPFLLNPSGWYRR
jgi:hypothetical protein